MNIFTPKNTTGWQIVLRDNPSCFDFDVRTFQFGIFNLKTEIPRGSAINSSMYRGFWIRKDWKPFWNQDKARVTFKYFNKTFWYFVTAINALGFAVHIGEWLYTHNDGTLALATIQMVAALLSWFNAKY